MIGAGDLLEEPRVEGPIEGEKIINFSGDFRMSSVDEPAATADEKLTAAVDHK